MIQRTKELMDKYKTLSIDETQELVSLIVKEEKEKLGLSLPISLDFKDLKGEKVGGNTSLIIDPETKRPMYAININLRDKFADFINNQNKITEYKTTEMLFDNGMDSLYSLIAQVTHEMRHAYQYECTHVKRNLKNNQALLWIKEQMAMPQNTYEENYLECFTEQDAYNYMYKEALNYIDEYTSIERDNPKFYEELQKQANSKKLKDIKDTKCVLNGNEMLMTEALNILFENRIKGIPEETVKKSIIRYEYDADRSNRTKKNYEQLMNDKNEAISKLDKKSLVYEKEVKKIENIYEFIIECDESLKREKEALQKQKQENDKNIQESSVNKQDENKNNENIESEHKEEQKNDEIKQEKSNRDTENQEVTNVSTLQLGNETLEIHQMDLDEVFNVEKTLNADKEMYEEIEKNKEEQNKTFSQRGTVSDEVKEHVNKCLKQQKEQQSEEKVSLKSNDNIKNQKADKGQKSENEINLKTDDDIGNQELDDGER